MWTARGTRNYLTRSACARIFSRVVFSRCETRIAVIIALVSAVACSDSPVAPATPVTESFTADLSAAAPDVYTSTNQALTAGTWSLHATLTSVAGVFVTVGAFDAAQVGLLGTEVVAPQITQNVIDVSWSAGVHFRATVHFQLFSGSSVHITYTFTHP
jgi:hypothetical protein